jgi:hypothetical protein
MPLAMSDAHHLHSPNFESLIEHSSAPASKNECVVILVSC